MDRSRKYHLILRRIRLQSGLTQAQIAQRIGETQSYVSKYENGEQRLDLFELEKICDAIGIPLLDFIRMYLEA